MKEAQFYDVLPDNKVVCRLCPHTCKIAQDGLGACGARGNKNGKLIAESYSKVTSLALDPIEKKPLYKFYPGTKILSLGSYGCNFHCGFCQNYQISMQQAPFRILQPGEIAAASLELGSQGNIGVAYTYNEPLIGWEFVYDCAKLISEQNQKNVIVSNGFICEEPLRRLLHLTDAMNIDLKSINPRFYKNIGGKLEDVLRTIEIAAKECHVEVTTLIIAGENDSDEEMEALAGKIANIDDRIVLHISRFFPAYKYQNAKATPKETVYKLTEIAKKHLEYVYTGNC